MKPSVEQIKAALEKEAKAHALVPESLQLDIPPTILSPHNSGYKHAAQCACGHLFEVVTQHSGKVPQGAMEVQAAMMADYAEHFRSAVAEMVYLMHNGTQ
jgi:hypothetical protein